MSTPVGPYTPVVRAGDLVVCSGQIGLDSGASPPGLVPGGVAAQTKQALANLRTLLESEGLGWAEVFKTTVYLADIADYAVFNEAYVEVLGEHRPARAAVAVSGLPLGALVEIDAWAKARS
jgi:2-iminobutanoate/2-iminopropanoate deaminase